MGTLDLPDASVVYIDTSIVIYTVEQVVDYSTLLESLWYKLFANQIRVFSSELILLEALVLPVRQANAGLINAYEQLLLASQIQLVPITQTILREAANLRAATSLKIPDAIHAATALNQGCTLFLTNDSQFRTVSGLSPIVLRELLTI